MKRIFPIALLTAGMVLGGGFLLTQGGGTNTSQFAVPGAAMAQEANAETREIVEMVLGAEDAPVEIIEYASYTCPHCANFHTDVFDEIKKNYIETGKVKFVYREVYFDKYGI
ncbi:MAG: thioredoxin domain-containing protein, partial [Pseudomonadota bacterium]|nr:thioredoxin domain-containing protein [Pseudomonadota bacterium]